MKQCKCGSMAFNLAPEIEQGDLCDRHYWQDRAEKAEKNIEACRESLEDSRDDVSEVLRFRKELAGYKRYDDEIKVIEAQLARHDEVLAAITEHRSASGHRLQSPDANAHVEDSGVLGTTAMDAP